MGQKVNPNGFRYGVTKEHNAIWYADKKDFAPNLLEDVKIHRFFEKITREYLIGNTKIRRDQDNKVTVVVYTAKLGTFLGQSGSNLKKIIEDGKKYVKNKKTCFKHRCSRKWKTRFRCKIISWINCN